MKNFIFYDYKLYYFCKTFIKKKLNKKKNIKQELLF